MNESREAARVPRACIAAPSPLLTVTIERGADGNDELHLHPGGQGFWIARLVAVLGVEVTLCASFGGEVGKVVRELIDLPGVEVRAVETASSNGAYVHDRRGGERDEIAHISPSPLSRHDADELYGATLVAGLESTVCVLGGPPHVTPVLPADGYRRLAADLRSNGTRVVADLSGDFLDAVLDGGVDVLKISDEELQRDGVVADDDPATLRRAVRLLADRGADNVVLTRADRPAWALLAGRWYEVRGPVLEAVDHRGAGDSLTAGLAAGIARGMSLEESLRLGAAAGGLNVTRRGLATGAREEIERLTSHVEVVESDDGDLASLV